MEEKKFYTKWQFWTIIIIFCILFGISNNKTTTISNNNNTIQNTIAANSSAMVDNLILKAKQDAKALSSEEFDNALSFIEKNINNLHKDNETMEKAIYFGALLENSNDNILKEIGTDTIQAVKYVYRNIEKTNDVSTQENLKQIKDNLLKLK